MLDAGRPSITTLEELLPLLEGVTKVKEFGWIIIQNVPTKPRSLKRQLARAARDFYGHGWTDKTLSDFLKPGCHTTKRADTKRLANRQYTAAWMAVSENKERKLATDAAWRAENSNFLRDYHTEYYQVRLANDPAFKIAHYLRNRLLQAVKAGGAGKSASTMELTGCTLPKLMAHLESQFSEGMTWKNQGLWHIDHRVPCASFDLTDPEQQRQCFHWTNLQPLWAADNLAKRDKLDWSPSAKAEPQV